MISVIIPVYNGEKYLDECLSSVVDAGIEITVVLDGCTDNSETIAKKHTENVINIEHSGAVIARNTGLKNSHGEYIMFMDADDVLVKGWNKILLDNIGDYDGVIALRKDFVSPECNNIPQQPESKISSHGVIAGCALFKKSAFDKIGSFDEDLLCGDGYEWLIRAEKSGLKINKIEDVVCNRRLHNSNMGRNLKDQEYKDYIKIIRKHFAKKQ